MNNPFTRVFHLVWMMVLLNPYSLSATDLIPAENTGTVTAYVWDDQNGDGRQNDNEPALEGITVKLLRASNNSTITSLATDADGEVEFSALAPGSYKIEVVEPAGHAITVKDANSVPESRDSDVSTTSGRSGSFTVSAGQNVDNQDAGLWTPGQVTAYVWDDRNGDGRQNDNEPGVTGVEVRLLNSSNNPVKYPVGDANEGQNVVATTGMNGEAILPYAPANIDLKLEFKSPIGHKFTTKDENGVPDDRDSDASESSGRTATFRANKGNQNFTKWDAGLFTPGQVTAYVWDDRNGDGRQNDNEPGVSGVEVRLLNGSNNPVKYPVGDANAGQNVVGFTGANGEAVLPYAPANIDLKLEFIRPTGHKFTTKDKNGVPDDKDSDASESSGRTATFRANEGSQNFTKWDAGLFVPGQVTAYVWDDRNGDGRQNDNEPGVSGVEVRLLNGSNNPVKYPSGPNMGDPVTGTTGMNGEAVLDYAPADIDLKLQFVRPTDHKFTTKDENGVPDDRDSDASESSGRTGTFSASKGSQNFEKWDAGLFVPGTVLTYVWDDRNGDGRQNDNEPGVGDVDVKLLNASNQPIVYPQGHPNAGQQVMATTNGDGEALLDYAPADRDLKLVFDLPEDHKFTGKDANNVPDDRDSDASESSGRTGTFRASKGSQKFEKWDAGLWTPGQAVAYVWEDANNNGRQNDNETGIYGMRVNLLESNNQPVTRPNGSEVFALTECGSFEAVLDYVPADRPVKLEFIPFTNGVFTDKDANGVPDDRDSDASESSGRTGTFQASKGNQTFEKWDAGFTTRGDFADANVEAFVWNDVENLGTQSGFERDNEGIENIKVSLLDGSGRECLCARTDASGTAKLPAIGGRQYRLSFGLPQDYKFTNKQGSITQGNNSDPGNDGRTGKFDVDPGETVTYVDAGMWAPGVVRTLVWNDIENIGTQSGFERDNEGVEDILVELLESNGDPVINPNGNQAVTAMTGMDGIAELDYVPANRTLRLRYTLPNGDWKFTTKQGGITQGNNSDTGNDGRTGTFSVSSGSDLIEFVDAGMWAPGTVKTLVWNDVENIGTQSGFERDNEGVEDILVELLESNGDPVTNPENNNMPVTAMTDENGIAHLDYVPASRNLRLRYSLPNADWKFTTKQGGISQGNNSDVGNDGRTGTFNADRGSDLTEFVDAGMWAPGTVKTLVWNDVENIGTQSGFERDNEGVEGVLVELLESNGTAVTDPTNNNMPVTALTDEDGIAHIDYVPASRSVRLRYSLPNADWKFTTKQGGISQGNNSDVGNDGRTGTFNADRGSDLTEFVDAGMWAPGTIKTFVWDDIENIGTQSGSERDNEGVEGILVELLESNGTAVTDPTNNNMPVTALTDENGIAHIDYVPASRSVRLQYTLPNADWKFTTKQGGISQGNNSDVGNDGRTGTFNSDRGSDLTEFVDAGMWSPGQVVAYVWEDANGNGIQNGSETGIFGLRVNLLENNGSPVLRPNGSPVTAVTECGSFEATLDYVPASRPVRVEFVPFDGGVFTTKSGSITQGNNSDASPNNGRTGAFSADRGNRTYTFVDAGFTDRGNFSDANVIARVWNDRDGDGKQDGSENNDDIEGVKVNLTDTDGNSCICVETDADGLANLPGFSGENYQLKFELPDDHYFTLQDQTSNGTNESNDSDARQTAGNSENIGKTSTFSLAPGQTITNIDAGLWVPGTVTARAWNDRDGDGKQDGSENDDDLEGIEVTVTETDGTPLVNPNNNQVVSGTTGTNGEVTLYVPADRAFQLKFGLEADYAFTPENETANGTNDSNDSDARQTAGNVANIGRTDSYRADRGSQSFTQIDAGYWIPGTVVARVWNDRDGDGKQDGDENGDDVAGVQVTVTEDDGTPLVPPNNEVVSDMTDGNGEVSLYVPADRPFQLKFDLPVDHAFTGQNVMTNGTNDGNDSDARQNAGNIANIGRTDTYRADRGSQTFTQIDAGLWVPGSVTARAWNDRDGDGKQDGSENGDDLEGISVRVTEADGTDLIDPNTNSVSDGTTGPNGEVTLYVPADRPFQLKFDLPPDHAFTPEDVTTNGTNDSNDSDARKSAGNQANIGRTDSYQADRGSQSFTQIDAGYWVPGTVIARVWNDRDQDGKQDGSESGDNLAGVFVEVLEADGSILIDAINSEDVNGLTGINGEVELYVPADRPFILRFGAVNGFDYTLDNVTTNGTNDSNDSDARDEAGNVDNLGKTPPYQASRGSQVFTQIDAGYFQESFLRDAGDDLEFTDSTGDDLYNDDQQLGADMGIERNLPAEVQNQAFDDLTLFPVPASDRLNVVVNLTESQSVDYAIIDATGRSLRIEKVELFEGHNQLDLDVRNLPAGQYYLQLRTSAELKTKVFTVVR